MTNILPVYSANNTASLIMQFLINHLKAFAIKRRLFQEKGKDIMAGTEGTKTIIHPLSTRSFHSY